MDGYSDSAFRRLCKAVNPEVITYTEFTSADGLFHSAAKVKQKLAFDASEQPILAQIFGKNRETFVAAAKLCEDMGFTGVDINMGCPSKKVVKSEHGVALRKKEGLAFDLIEAVATATALPVSVKTRLGWGNAEGLVEFGIGAQNAGANMICIHGRTYVEPYNVPADWNPIYELKRHLSIPVLGNGGVEDRADGLAKLGNLDGFLIGQATFGNPWVFAPDGPPKTFAEKVPLILQHAQWMIESKGPEVGAREMRKHLLSYVKAIPGARQYRSQLANVWTLDDITTVLDQILQAG